MAKRERDDRRGRGEPRRGSARDDRGSASASNHSEGGNHGSLSNPNSAPASTRPAPAERVIARLRPNARALFWPAILLLAVCGSVGYFGGSFPLVWENVLVFVVAAIVVFLLCVLPLCFWLSRRYVITTRRIIVHRGFFVRIRQELLHSRGYDITLRRTWLQSAFRSGDIRINSGLETPVVLADVPRADQVQSALHDLAESSQNVIASRRQQEESAAGDITSVWGAR
ncbi:PH domain-containing protein [Microbacterium sp. STN6]|uniref:PH domain-containing protein n=1 Tax=Microbacterium sp. STN6 TaxID=2995588 RepID=UPI002260D723|nr:PH domain-containing protein [Microbacterium sp. STN6]MCX7520993.1 PH domain-containing protein [Microbacterium sp. STN6]